MAQALRLLMLFMAVPSLAALPLAGSLLAGPGLAGPVVCTTTIEAPQARQAQLVRQASVRPVELTRCGGVQTTSQLVEKRFYSYTAPFARGIDITHQITDLLGISMGGGDGTKVMGFGFPDQTIVWDGTALDNTYQVLLENQSELIPWRTGDVGNGFSSSLGSAASSGSGSAASFGAPVRGLW
jgi:hypothetical protein